MSTVNFAEVVAKLADAGMPAEAIHQALDVLGIDLVPFDENLAFRTGILRPATKSLGLSLGDRACLALAEALGLPAFTADRRWQELQTSIEIRSLR